MVALVPVKSLERAKGRLAPVLGPAERRLLTLAMLDDVLAALAATRGIASIALVSSDATVLERARARGLLAIYDRAGDLNGALDQAAREAAGRGAGALVILPADLPLVTPAEIEALIATIPPDSAGVTIAPARDGGTNALLMRPPLVLPFRFGPDSYRWHLEAAHERGLVPRRYQAPGFDLDVDRPDDLARLVRSPGDSAAQRLARGLVPVACE